MTLHDPSNTCEMDAGTAATLQHVEMLHKRQQKLVAMRDEAEHQMLHRLGIDYRAGHVSDSQLAAVFQRLKQLEIPGRSTRWDAHIPHDWAAMGDLFRWKPNGPNGTFVGEWPLHPRAVAPRGGKSVVYVLFDASNEPCYVGSSCNLRQRLKAHARDGKVFTSWQAYPCRDREHAYELEVQLLRERMPRLNRKAGR